MHFDLPKSAGGISTKVSGGASSKESVYSLRQLGFVLQVSPYTLKLNDPMLHSKFIQTLRSDIVPIANRLFIVLSSFSVIYLAI